MPVLSQIIQVILMPIAMSTNHWDLTLMNVFNVRIIMFIRNLLMVKRRFVCKKLLTVSVTIKMVHVQNVMMIRIQFGVEVNGFVQLLWFN